MAEPFSELGKADQREALEYSRTIGFHDADNIGCDD